MKRWFVLNALLLIALALFLWWQTPRDPNVLYDESLSDKLKNEISAVFLEEYDFEFHWDRVKPDIGTINDCTVFISQGGLSVEIEVYRVIVADFEFRSSIPLALYAYRNGEVCSLQEAYEGGWLTKEHIGLLHAKYEEIQQNWAVYYQQYLDQKEADKNSSEANILYQKELTDRDKENIRSRVLDKYDEIVRWGYVDPYYGTINNYSVVIVHPHKPSEEGAWAQEIAGYIFEWDSTVGLYVYYHCKYESLSYVYTLQAAYEKGLLTEKQIGEIYERHVLYRLEFSHLLEEWEKSREE